MRERPVTTPAPIPAAFINAQNAITGLRGRDLLSTLRSVAAHGLRNPVHTARHVLALGGQLGRVLLGETVQEPNPRDARFIDPTWTLNPLYRRSLQAYLSWQKQTRHWIDDSTLSADDRARAHFAFPCSTMQSPPPTPCLTRWRSRNCSIPVATAWCAA